MERLGFRVLAGGCNGCTSGQCPTVYESADGRVFVQGYVVSGGLHEEVGVPANEALVEINRELLEKVAALILKNAG